MALQSIQALSGVLLFGCYVLATPPPGHVPVPSNDLHPPKYEYGYVVADQGSSQGHMETRDGIFALGRYHVSLPDGSGQKVTYFADDWGYHPLVSYGSATGHSNSHTHFAMGDQAVNALLKNMDSQVSGHLASVISSPAQPIVVSSTANAAPAVSTETHVAVQVSSSAEGVTSSPAEAVHVTSSTAGVQVTSAPAVKVQVYNDGASGHNDHSLDAAAPLSAASTTPLPPTSLFTPNTTPIPVTEAPPLSFHQLDHSSVSSISTSIPLVPVTAAPSPAPAFQAASITQSQVQQQREAEIIQLELQNHIQQTISKLEQSASQQVSETPAIFEDYNLQTLHQQKQSIPHQDIYNGIQQATQNQQEIQEEINNRIQQNTQEQINALQRQQIEQQQLQNQIRLSAQQGIQQQRDSSLFQPLAPASAVSVSPAVHYVSANAEQVISVLPEHHSPLAHILSQESNSIQKNRVEIVTPTPIAYNKEYETFPALSGNSIVANDTPANSVFTVDGQNVQITSYLADTNRVLQFGDRLRVRERLQDQHLIDEIERHAKQRIFQDLRRPAGAFGKPIVVNPATYASQASRLHGGVSTVIQPPSASTSPDSIPHGTPSPTLLPPINHGYLQSNSLSHAVYGNADLSQTHVGVIGNAAGYNNRPYVSVDQLAPLQAGVAMLSASSSDKNSVPVSEESTEDESYNIINVQGSAPASAPGQYQALGYERRLVDQRAQHVINEPNPTAQVQKAVTLAQQQENELRQLQQDVKELQQKIVDDIDAQHEEEQRKQEIVNNERQQHRESLQKVEELIQTAQVNSTGAQESHATSASDFGEFQGPQYLPPLEATAPSYHHTPSSATITSYQNVAITSSGQDVHAVSVNTGPQESPLAISPAQPQLVEIERPVFIEKPVAVETTKVVEVEKPVIVKEIVPVESTKFIEVEKSVPYLQPYPVAVTRLVTLDRPVAVPTPYSVPQPYPVPYAVPHLVPYPEVVPIPFKQYHPVYIHTKSHKGYTPSQRLPDQIFKEPNPELFRISHSYHTIPYTLKSVPHKSSYHRRPYKSYESYGRNKNYLKNLRIEYGGFKPPLIPSAEFSEEPLPSQYGPSVKE